MRCRKLFLTCVAVFVTGSISAYLHAADAATAEYLSDSLADRILSASQAWGELGINTSAAASRPQALKLRIKDKEYAHGLGHHADGEIVVELAGQFKSFEAEIGVEWLGGNTPASVVFQIYVDDKKVFESGVMRENDPPRPVSVSVDGAEELRLVVQNAGDGIHSDLGNWADARLIRNPSAAKKTRESAVDVAPFGRVAAWDPKIMHGTKANRVQEMPAEDVFPAKELLPTERGTYLVPIENKTGCIGLQWDENRILRRVELQFREAAAVPPVGSIQMQYWTGESAWQGTWQPAELVPEKIENRLVWSFRLQDLARGTQKVRWVFSDAQEPIELKSLSAYSRSLWKTVDLQLESTQPASSQKAEIEIYNGIFSGQTGKSAYHCTWDTSKRLSLKVRASKAQQYKADRTVLRIQLAGTAFGIAVEDLLANDCVYVPHAGVFATRLPAPVTLAEYLKQIADQKTVLEEVRLQPDQDFSRVWKVVHHAVQDIMPTMISLANDNRKFVVGRHGGIQFDQYDYPDGPRNAPPSTIYTISFSAPWQCTPIFGSGRDQTPARRLQGGWLPIPTVSVTEGAVSYEQAAYVAPASEARADAPFWYRDRALCVAEYRIKNNAKEAASARLALNFSHAQKKPFQLQEVQEGVLVVQDGRVLALIDTRGASPLSVKMEAESAVISGDLPAESSAACATYFPAWQVDVKDYAVLLKDNELESRVESYWKALLEPAMQIELPDPLLNDIIRASQVHCMLAGRNEKGGEQISAWTAAVLYGPLESESNSIIRGMDMVGQDDFARRGLEYLLGKCSKEGFITVGYTLVGTGEVLWTLSEHYERTHDREWMKKVAPEVAKICQWIIRQREKTKRLDAQGQKAPEYGLMTPGVSADWNRFAYRFFNDAYFYAGLASAGRALADIGDPAAAAILEDARQYREDIVRAYHWNQARSPVVKLNDGTWVPSDPSLLDCFGHVEYFIPGEDAGRTWAYSIELGSHHLAATNILEPKSRDATWMTDYLEDVQFLRTGMGDYPEALNRTDVFCFGGFGKVQPYYGRNAEIYAGRDDVKPFIRSYFNAIPTLVNAENLSFCEHFSNYGAWNKTHETGWFLCQTRIMLIDERGDQLWLAPFVTNRWLEDGKKVAISNAPTRFGQVSYAITSKAAQGQIEAVVHLPAKCPAKKIVLRLRHPEGKPIKSVTVQGKPHSDFDPQQETITLDPTAEKINVRAEY